MSKSMKLNKAVGNDGITSEIFNIARHKECKNNETELCVRCKQKIKIVKILVSKEYWKSNYSELSRVGRYIPLNKVFPQIPAPG